MAESDLERLTAALRARHPCIIVTSYDESHVLETLAAAALEVGQELSTWSVTLGLRDGVMKPPRVVPSTENPAGALEHVVRHAAPRGPVVFCDLSEHLKEPAALRLLREAIDRYEQAGLSIVLLDHRGTFPPVIESSAQRPDLSFPSAVELEELTLAALRRLKDSGAAFTLSLSKAELKRLAANLAGLTRQQARRAIAEAVCHDRRFDASDIASVLRSKRQMLAGSGLLQFVESPATLDDIGGLNRLKAWLIARGKSLSDDARAFGLEAPRGVLLLGVQGAGKSLAAKAVATAWQRPLLRMDVGALYDKYIGESEKRLTDALRQAEAMSPAVLWIDEVEKAFAGASSQSSDGGLSRRMFGSLLTWMQEHRKPVFTIATANDIDALPPELLRKGRFDEIFFVDLPAAEAREAILRIHAARRELLPNTIDVRGAAAASEGFSGAELEQAIIAAMHLAYEHGRAMTAADLREVIRTSPPLSVTMREKIDALRAWSRGRCVPAD